MAFSEKYIPLQGVNIDLAPALMPNNLATFIKNLVYAIEDTSDGNKSKSSDTGIFKTYQSNKKYSDQFTLPAGTNYCIGALSSKETNQVFFWTHNSQSNHAIYVIDGERREISLIDIGPHLNHQLKPEYFIHTGAANIVVLWITDPDTGEKKKKTYLNYTDGHNQQRFTCVEDAIATAGFDADLFSFFGGDYDPNIFLNAGVAPPTECIDISEIPLTPESEKRNNTLLFYGWQFASRYIDVWGRPSEYGIRSDLYIPGINDCISSSSNIPNCIQLLLEVPPKNIDKIEIAYRKDNSSQWYTADTLDLYVGSPLGKWWERSPNPEVKFDLDTGKIKYEFCNNRECKPISQDLTFRLENPMPRTSQSASIVGKTEGYSNNKYGYSPFSKELLDKIKIEVIPPEASDNIIAPRNITVYVPIYNPYRDNFQQVFKDGDLGYAWGDNNSKHGGARAYKQYFENINQAGFNGYLVGGGSAISTQVYVSSSSELIDDTEHEGTEISQLRYNNTGYTMQKFVFSNVPAGIYVFRLSSHLSNPDTDVNYRRTSTTVFGVCPLTPGQLIPNTKTVYHTHELIIDVCNSDYNTLDAGEMLVVADLAAFANGGFLNGDIRSIAYCGYITESSSDDGINIPMELIGLESFFSTTGITDHNGFYWLSAFLPIYIHGMDGRFTFLNKCIPVVAKREFTTHNMVMENLAITSIDGSKYSDYAKVECNRVLIKGKLILEGTNIGIPDVDVVLTRGQSATSDVDGEFTIIAHDDMQNNPREDQLIITNGKCRYYKNGQSCIPPIDLSIYRCTTCNGERIIEVGEIFLSADFTQRGLLSGGTYPIGVAGKDFLDRSQFVQDLGYVTIPSFQETGVFRPSQIKISFEDGFVAPEEFKHLVFYLGDETTLQSYVTWIVDSFEFIDNTGSVNTVNPTQIKIYYSSLIEYNKQNNYNTTVNWGFINEGNNNQPHTNDNVLFLVNGDGTRFDAAIVSRVKYAQDGEYFLINYSESLKDLKANAFIRLYRLKDCENQEPLFERCNSIKLVNGIPEVDSFILNAFDTYYINREIPVPIQAPTENDEEEETDTVNERRIFALPFEHDSPSDFWGKGIRNIGRQNVKNPYEAIIYKQDEIALSGSFSNSGYINFLNFFDNNLKFDFDKNNLNGITSVLAQPGIVLFIGQNNNLVVGYDDNLVRVNPDGTLRIPSATELFGRPSPNPRFNYGCHLKDKNSIAEYEGMVHWLDRTSCAVIQHDYVNAVDISALKCSSYIRAKIKEVQNYEGDRYFTGVCNPIATEYILSDKVIGAEYVNHLRQYDVTAQETIVFDIYSKRFKGWRGYVAEYYSHLCGESQEQQLFSFKNGIPYFHYDVNAVNGYGEFFGEEVERILEVIVNTDNLKKKKSLSTAVYSHNLYWVDRVITEAGQDSWIPIAYWRQGNFMWSAPMLCDLNTFDDPNHPKLNKLVDGNVLYGNWIKIRYIGLADDNKKYTELTGITVDVFPQEKSST